MCDVLTRGSKELLSLRLFTCLVVFLSLFPISGFALEEPEAIRFPVHTFTLIGEPPIPNEEINALLSSFEGKQYDLLDLQKASKKIEQLIRDKGFAFYRVTLPPQSLADGVVSLKLVSFAVSDIELVGNKHFDTKNILRSLPGLVVGQSPNTQTLAQQIKVANFHADKELSVTFKQSDIADKVTAKVGALDNKPYQASLTINNTGSEATGDIRVTGALQYSNLWNQDHRANFSYTTSPGHTSDVEQIGLSYSLPLYGLGGWLVAYYSHSDVNTGNVPIGGGASFDVAGSGEMFGFNYLQTLSRIGRYEHSVSAGIDNRFFDNTIEYIENGNELGDIASDVRSTPITLGYKGDITLKEVSIGHSVSWSKNLGMGSKNDNDAYNETRANAKHGWDLIRYSLLVNKDIEGWLLRANLQGQYSNEALIPGEQFGLGGSRSIRGYEEREVGSDVGNSISLEAYTPQWKNARLLAFYDYGHGRNQDTLAGEENHWNLASIGIGLRWQWKNNIQLNADMGYTLKEGLVTPDNDSHLHVNVVFQY